MMSEEVVETTIVGVTDTGVIRKRSVKKRICREESQSQRAYGHAKDDYQKLWQRILGEKAVANSVEVLQERWRMVMYMYDDCLELVKQWEDRRAVLWRHKRKKRLLLLAVLLLPLVLSLGACWLARCFCSFMWSPIMAGLPLKYKKN